MARSAETAPLLTLGVMARSRKENERRLPIHPEHIDRIDPELRAQIFVEEGYGLPFGVSDETLAESLGGVRTRAELIEQCDVILQPKVQSEDLAELRDGQIVWGWPHCVQDTPLTQEAIDRRLTLIAFEAMNHWARDGSFLLHVFHLNNELAGYSSVHPCAGPVGHDRHLRPQAARRRHRLRRDRSRCRDCPERAGDRRRPGAHQPQRRRRRVTDPLGADRPPRPRR